MPMEPLPIYIEAPARLHLGFLDLEGGLGRRFGSFGLTIEDVATKITVRRAKHVEVIGDESGRVQNYAQKFCERKGLAGGCLIDVTEKILDHSGLGSGTQLALAVGTAITEIYNLTCSASEIAVTLNRGARSGIGIGAFQQGGFLVDGGRTTQSTVPPIISRMQFPSNWRVLLIFDVNHRGLHGEDERTSFTSLPSFSSQTAAHLCRLMLLQVLPAITEQDIQVFSKGIFEIQRCLGEFFASIQGGRYTSASVGDAITYLESLGIQGVGQSSWGPTGFAFVDSETHAHTLLRELQTKYTNHQDLQFKIVSGRNSGAKIEKQNIQQDTVSLSKAIKS